MDSLTSVALAAHNSYIPAALFAVGCVAIVALISPTLLHYAIGCMFVVFMAPYALAIVVIGLAIFGLVATIFAIALWAVLKSLGTQFKRLGW